jgi:hypothetical protein
MNYEAIVVIATLIIALTHIIYQEIQIKKLKKKCEDLEGYVGVCEEEIQEKEQIINERTPPAVGVPMMIAMAEVVG